MDKSRHIIISLLIIFISFFFFNAGKINPFIGENITIHLNNNQTTDLEIPDHHTSNRSDDYEKWMNFNLNEIICSSEIFFLFRDYPIKRTEDYKGVVWQPPKSV
jgi:hypothetical protein